MPGKVNIDGTNYKNIVYGKINVDGTNYEDINYGKVGLSGGGYGTIYLSKVPKEYQQVKYLESSGSQYVVAPFQSQENLRVETEVTPFSDNNGSDSACFGCVPNILAVSRQSFHISWYPSGGASYRYSLANMGGTSLKITRSSQYSTSVLYPVIIDFGSTSRAPSMNFNGETVTGEPPESFTGGNTFYLFRHRTNLSTIGGRIGIFKAYSGDNTLIAEMYPCYRKSDNVAGYWDHVSKSFIAGNGTFTLGPDV